MARHDYPDPEKVRPLDPTPMSPAPAPVEPEADPTPIEKPPTESK